MNQPAQGRVVARVLMTVIGPVVVSMAVVVLVAHEPSITEKRHCSTSTPAPPTLLRTGRGAGV
jgi:hypothetical protein